MSQIGIGLYSLAGVYGKKDPAEVRRMLCQAVEWGIRFFDVADQYGPAEEVLGTALHSVRSRIEISTKVGLTGDGGRDCSPGHIMEACRQSMRRLRTDYLDYYQIHFDDPDTPIEETIGALEDLRRQGYIRHYNIGHLPMKRVREYAEKGHPAAVMMELSPVAFRSYRDGLSFLNERELFVIAMGTAGRGLLTGQIGENHRFPAGDIRRIDPLFAHSLRQSAYRVLHKLTEVGEGYGKSPIQIALNWVLRLARVGVVLTGPSTVAHLAENLGAQGWHLAKEDADELNRFIQEEEARKQNALRMDLLGLMNKPRVTDGEQAVTDLIYVVSGLLDLGWADEKEVLPVFREILKWRQETDEAGSFYAAMIERLRPYLASIRSS